jgi:Protein of unknown function (DUF3352)
MGAFFVRRALTSTGVVAMAALVAVGCGGSGGGGAAGGAGAAASGDGGVLDYVPQDTVVYFTADADFDGDNWKQADEHGKKFDGYEEQRDKALAEAFKGEDGEEDVKWEDIKPWLGDTIGGAFWGSLSSDEEDAEDGKADMNGVVWAQVKDKEKAQSFIEDEGGKKTGTEGDFTLYEDETTEEGEDPTLMALGEDIVLIGETEADLKRSIKAKDGDSVLDDEGTKSVAEEIEDDALMAVVVSGEGVREAIKDGSEDEESTRKALGIKQVKAFEGLSFGVSANDEGFQLHGYAGFDKDELGDEELGGEFEPTLLRDLPADTMLAIAAEDLGAQLKKVTEAIADSDKEAAEGVAQLESVLGVSIDDINDAYKGQFTLSVGSETEGAGDGAAAGIVGALPAVSLVTEVGDEAKAQTVTEKLIGLSQLQAGTPPKDVTVGEIEGKEASIGGMSVIAGTGDGHSIITTSRSFIEALGGDDTLDGDDSFNENWDAAEAPDEVAGAFYLDVQKAIEFAKGLGQDPEAAGVDTSPLGALVGWANVEDDSVSFDLFMRVEEGDEGDSADEAADTTASTTEDESGDTTSTTETTTSTMEDEG